jgi:hypothetical protein
VKEFCALCACLFFNWLVPQVAATAVGLWVAWPAWLQRELPEGIKLCDQAAMHGLFKLADRPVIYKTFQEPAPGGSVALQLAQANCLLTEWDEQHNDAARSKQLHITRWGRLV